MGKTKTLLALLLLVMTTLCASAYDFYTGGIYYNITNSSKKTVEVTYKYAYESSYSGSVNIPVSVTYNGATYHVTSIGQSAFYYCYGL